jgi:tRNA G18 (ribose-2'-O)-methylase SpoU
MSYHLMVPVERILHPDDPRIGLYRQVSDPELLRAHGLFVAEGRLVAQRVIEDGRYTLHSLLLNEAARRSLDAPLSRVASQVPIYVCDASDFPRITGFNIHRGCLALVFRPVPLTTDAVLGGARRIVVLDAVANADNVGGVFRNVAAFGADGVLLGPTTCDPLYRKAVRTSVAATLRVPFARVDSWQDTAERLHQHEFTTVALTPRSPSEDLESFAARARADRFALIVGNEGSGLSPEAEASADVRVRIPISPGVDSLNLAVAAAIALYRLR